MRSKQIQTVFLEFFFFFCPVTRFTQFATDVTALLSHSHNSVKSKHRLLQSAELTLYCGGGSGGSLLSTEGKHPKIHLEIIEKKPKKTPDLGSISFNETFTFPNLQFCFLYSFPHWRFRLSFKMLFCAFCEQHVIRSINHSRKHFNTESSLHCWCRLTNFRYKYEHSDKDIFVK